MRYLTHSLLHQLSEVQKPRRQIRDSFGLHSACCWCCFLTSLVDANNAHLTNASEQTSTNTDLCASTGLHTGISSPASRHLTPRSGSSESSHASIELSDISHSPSHSTPPSSISVPSSSSCQPNLPKPPKAHCRTTTTPHNNNNKPVPSLPPLPTPNNTSPTPKQ